MTKSRSGTSAEEMQSNQQDVKLKLKLETRARARGDQDQDEYELLPLLRLRCGRGGPTTVGRILKQHKINNQLGKRGISVLGMGLGSLPLPNRRAPNLPSLPFQLGNGDLNRRGPIPDLEILPGRRNEPSFRRQRQHALPPAHFDGAIISDSDGEEEEVEVEEHEYLPTRSNTGSGNCIDNISVKMVG